jgi:hypothetical protein
VIDSFIASLETGHAPRIAVTLVDYVVDAKLALDARHLVLWLRTKGGAMPLAVPCEELPLVIDHCAQALAQRKARADLSCDLTIVPVTWFNSSVDRQSHELTLALTFGHGGTLSFVFSEPMSHALHATLRAIHGPARAAAQKQRPPWLAWLRTLVRAGQISNGGRTCSSAQSSSTAGTSNGSRSA